MEKFTLQNTPEASLKRSMREMFLDLVDITMEGAGKGCLKSVPTNYGHVFFWYGYIRRKALAKHYPDYVPKEKVKELRKIKKSDQTHKLQDQISDFLFSIVRDHPEVIGEGHAQVNFAVLTPRLKDMTIAEAAKSLKEFANRLEKLDDYIHKNLSKKNSRIVEEIQTRFGTIDYITQKEVAKYGDEYFWDDECGYFELAHRRLGCEVQIAIHFKGDETLGEVVERIDRAIAAIKEDLDLMFRFGKSQWPF